MSNLIYTLHSLSWAPVAYDAWSDDLGNTWKLDSCDSPSDLIRHLIQTYNRQQCIEASKHYNGKGMEDDVDWLVTLSYQKSLSGKDDYAARCALEAVISGSTWSNARIHEIISSHSEFCPRCGVVDSDLHTFWLCTHDKLIKHPAIESTDKLTQSACTEVADFPCLWLRGICPRQLTVIPEEHHPIAEYKVNFVAYNTPTDRAIVDSGTYYGDASGGRFSSYAPLIRCGVGVVKVGYNDNVIYREWGARLNLPGAVQTVPRAELYALQFILSEAIPGSNIEFVTDNKKNCEMFNKGPIAAARSANHDLFKLVFLCISSNHLQVTVRWMPSHLQDKLRADEHFQIPDGISLNDVTGNQWADDLAGQSATSYELPLNITTPYLYYKNLTRRIQKRLVVILCSLPNRPKHIPKAKIPADSFEECCNLSRHVIYEIDGRHIGCARCKQTRMIKGIGVRQWLSSACCAQRPEDDKPIPLFNEFIQIGNLNIHHSHKPYVYKDIYYCIQCGSYATNKLKKLASECRERTLAGARFLDNIYKGIFPSSIDNIHNTHNESVLNNVEQATLVNIQNFVNANTVIANIANDTDPTNQTDTNNPNNPIPEALASPESPLVGDSESD